MFWLDETICAVVDIILYLSDWLRSTIPAFTIFLCRPPLVLFIHTATHSCTWPTYEHYAWQTDIDHASHHHRKVYSFISYFYSEMVDSKKRLRWPSIIIIADTLINYHILHNKYHHISLVLAIHSVYIVWKAQTNYKIPVILSNWILFILVWRLVISS